MIPMQNTKRKKVKSKVVWLIVRIVAGIIAFLVFMYIILSLTTEINSPMEILKSIF